MSTKARRSLILTVIYVVFTGSTLALALHEENAADEIQTSRLAGTESSRALEFSARRAAGFGKAGAILATAFYLLGVGVLLAPGPIRLLSGNLAVFLGILVLIDVSSNLLGFHAPSLGRPGQEGRFSMWVYDETKGWFHRKSTLTETGIAGYDRFPVRLNALGLRGPEIEAERPDSLRVLVFGDSFVFGVGVAEERLLTAHLARLLASSRSPVDVVNMGVTGYSTDQQYLLWQELGARLDPDLVILVVCDNDYIGNTENFAHRQYYKPYFELQPDGGLRLRNVPVPRLTRIQRVKLWLGRESNVWNFVRNRNAGQPRLRSLLRKLEVDVSRPPKAPYRTTAAIVKSFARDVESRGGWLLVTSTARRAEDPALFQNLSRNLEREGIHVLDMFPILDAARRREPDRAWDFRNDTHWNQDAHELAAVGIYQYLREHYLSSTVAKER